MPAIKPEKKTCRTCPSFLLRDEVTEIRQRDIGASMCARFGTVLGSDLATEEAEADLQDAHGEACESHGRERPLVVADPSRELLVSMGDRDKNKNPLATDVKSCTSCLLCSNYVPEGLVTQKTGWRAGMCAARGILVPPNATSRTARGCEYRSRGENRVEFPTALMFPDYARMLKEAEPARVEAPAVVSGSDDPLDHPTDVPVSLDDNRKGIVAWRRVKDRDGYGPDVFLPIFDQDYLGKAKALVPRTGDDEHPELHVDYLGAIYKIAVMWTQLGETPALWGAAGLGKTELYRHLAWLMGLPFHRISITGSTEVDDLVGKTAYTPERGTFWVDGRLPTAWRSPGVICLDEPNVGPPEVWQLIRPLTDNSKQLVLDLNAGERIPRHSGSYLGMAMNPSWDARNVGTNMLSDADGSRLMHVTVTLPPPAVEREIISRRVKLDGSELTEAQLDMLMEVSKSIRELVNEGTLAEVSWGVRHTIKVARSLRFFDMISAVRLATADYLAPDLQQSLLEQVRVHTKRKTKPERDAYRHSRKSTNFVPKFS